MGSSFYERSKFKCTSSVKGGLKTSDQGAISFSFESEWLRKEGRFSDSINVMLSESLAISGYFGHKKLRVAHAVWATILVCNTFSKQFDLPETISVLSIH